MLQKEKLDEFLEENCKCKNCNLYSDGICTMRNDPIGPDGLCADFRFGDKEMRNKEMRLMKNWYEQHLKEIAEAV